MSTVLFVIIKGLWSIRREPLDLTKKLGTKKGNYGILGRAYYSLGDYQRATEYLERAVRLKLSSRVKNRHFSKFPIKSFLSKRILGKNVFSVQTYGAQKFFSTLIILIDR